MKKEVFAKELAGLINRLSLESEFNDTPDYVLANVAVEAMEQFARNSARRDDYHEFRTADYEKKRNAILNQKRKFAPGGIVREPDNNQCNCPACTLRRMFGNDEPVINKRPYKKPEAFDVPKEVQVMAEFFGDMFPGTTVEIHRVEMPRRNPRDKRRGKNKRNNGKGGKQ